MHYFQVVLCTLLVPSKIPRGIFIEFSWKSIGSNLSGPLAGPFEKQAKTKKKKKTKEINGLQAGWPVQNLSGHWKSSKKSINPIKCLRAFFISFIQPSGTFSFPLYNPPRPFGFLIKPSKSSPRDCLGAARPAQGQPGPAGPAEKIRKKIFEELSTRVRFLASFE